MKEVEEEMEEREEGRGCVMERGKEKEEEEVWGVKGDGWRIKEVK